MSGDSQSFNEQYQLTRAEERYLQRFHQMQNAAATSGSPRTMIIIFDGRTASFFDGKPAGVDKLTSRE